MSGEYFWQRPAPVNRKVLCFTGHRPEKLPTGQILRILTDTLHYYIDDAVDRGYTCFYTGLADGIDYYAAEYLFTLRKTRPGLHIVGVQPCEDYRDFFRQRRYSCARLEFMLHCVDKLVVLPGSFRDHGAFFRRNQYMVDRSQAIIAVCSGGRSGSMQTLNYAKRSGLAYRQILVGEDPDHPSYLMMRPETWPMRQRGF